MKWWQRLGKASKAFGCLWSAIFQNRQLSVAIKRCVPWDGVVHLAVWGTDLDCESRQFEKDEGLPQPLHQVMSRLQQWKQRITSRELAETIGMTESTTEILRRHWLRWIGYVARMDDSRMPK